MADHGARVIKVENPRAPEPTRSADAFPWEQSGETVMFRNTQRGKESIALDLKTAAGKRALLQAGPPEATASAARSRPRRCRASASLRDSAAGRVYGVCSCAGKRAASTSSR